jgi:hypothetical protein
MPGGDEDPLIRLSERMVGRAEQRAAAASQPGAPRLLFWGRDDSQQVV